MCRFGFLSLVNTWEGSKGPKWFSASTYIAAGYREVIELIVEVYYTDSPTQKDQNGRWEQHLSIQQHFILVSRLKYHFPPNIIYIKLTVQLTKNLI